MSCGYASIMWVKELLAGILKTECPPYVPFKVIIETFPGKVKPTISKKIPLGLFTQAMDAITRDCIIRRVTTVEDIFQRIYHGLQDDDRFDNEYTRRAYDDATEDIYLKSDPFGELYYYWDNLTIPVLRDFAVHICNPSPEAIGMNALLHIADQMYNDTPKSEQKSYYIDFDAPSILESLDNDNLVDDQVIYQSILDMIQDGTRMYNVKYCYILEFIHRCYKRVGMDYPGETDIEAMNYMATTFVGICKRRQVKRTEYEVPNIKEGENENEQTDI